MNDKKDLDPRILNIAKRLKALRIKAGYKSYEHFALEHDLQRMAYWRIEKGSNLTLKTLFKILDIHGVGLEEFLSHTEVEINV